MVGLQNAFRLMGKLNVFANRRGFSYSSLRNQQDPTAVLRDEGSGIVLGECQNGGQGANQENVGLAVAQYNLGVMYQKGKVVPQDYKIAANWYRLAAEQGYANSYNNLGEMYRRGEGVIQDNVYAHMWFNIAASSGKNEKAPINREIVAQRMTPSQLEKAKDLARECVRKKYKGCWR